MAITRLDASNSVAAATLAYAVSGGTARCLIVMCGCEHSVASSVTSVDYGGQAMVQAYSAVTADSGFSACTSCWYLLDAGITAASGTTITPTYSVTPSDEMICAASYENVDQTGGATTVPDTATAESNEATPNPFTTIDLTEVSGGLIVASIACGNATTFAWQADMTEQEDLTDASSAMSFADRLSTTGANVTIEATVTSQNRASAGSARFAELTGVAITAVTPDDPLRMDQSSMTIDGSQFEASQGTGKVEISNNATTGSGTIVDVSTAIDTWADDEIVLDLSTLSAALLTDLHSLGPGDGNRYVHVTNDSAEESGGFAVHLMRPIAIALSLSPNIAASGENTTFQLAAPATKTTGDFGGGRIQDDENPTDTVDLDEDEYREDEWCMEALPKSLAEQTYQFRVLINSEVIDTYTVDPRWTISIARRVMVIT